MNPASSTVFVVDDDAPFRVAVARLLRSAGYRVETFASSAAFLPRAVASGPACAVLDLRLPDFNGIEVQERLAGAGATLPIIFLTGHGDIPTSVRAMKAGAVDFLTKPFEDLSLLAAVAHALDRDAEAHLRRSQAEKIWKRFAALTEREREVFHRVVSGLLNKQIAAGLGTCEQTVKVHRSHVMAKMRADSLADLVRMATQMEASARGSLPG